MGKFRSKLKRNKGGKSWSHGQSSTSNPAQMKHREKAKSRFFQQNLSLASSNSNTTNNNTLTLAAISKHDAIQSYKINEPESKVNDIASSLKSLNFNAGETGTVTQGTSFKSFQTFATNFTDCSNVSFSKLLHGFRGDSQVHKDMLAILAAITEVINEHKGKQTSTEYFLALMETIESATDDSDIIAALLLLSMGIKTVPVAVLRKKLSETSELLLNLLQKFADTENQNCLRSIISCMSVLLRAQEYIIWTLPSTLQLFDSILSFVIHTKPKIRKSAQNAISSIINGSCFLVNTDDESTPMVNSTIPDKIHPASNRVTKFCIKQFKPENIAHSQTIVSHTLGLLQNVLRGLKSDDIKIICEHLLSIMTTANVLIRTNCLQTLHLLFSSKTKNLPATLCGKLITALFEYRPDKYDVRQTIAWLTVMKESIICLSCTDLTMSIHLVPKLIEICVRDLWISDRIEIANTTSNVLKELFTDCLQLACTNKETAQQYKNNISKILEIMTNALQTPFGHLANQIILIFGIIFETTGKYFARELQQALRLIGDRYDEQSSFRLQIEHTLLSAISSMGPECVLKTIRITDDDGNVSLKRTWLLPLLREAVSESTLEFFTNYILQLAVKCNVNWKRYKAENNLPLAHTNELLCCQLWGLFPGFCRKPRDIHNFSYIAKTLGTALADNIEFRAPILDGLKELLNNADDDGKSQLAKFARNFLPRLFNIYSTKPTGTYEHDLRNSTFDLIQEYVKITPNEVRTSMFQTAKTQFETLDTNTYLSQSVFDILLLLALYEPSEQLKKLYDDVILPIMKRDKRTSVVAGDIQNLRKQQEQSYKFLYDLLISENAGCKEFVQDNMKSIKRCLFESLRKSSHSVQKSRLLCLKVFIEKQEEISLDSNFYKKAIVESVVAFNYNVNNKKENTALDIILYIGNLFEQSDRLNDFIDIIMAGFGGDMIHVSNTILALKSIINKHFNLTINTIDFILEQVLVILVTKNRTPVQAAVLFLIVFIKCLPVPLVCNYLPKIVKSLSLMVPDTKRYCRLNIGYIFRKLCIKFTAEEIIKLVPGNDEIMHKKLKNIRKELARNKRQKLEKSKANESDTDDDDNVGGKLEKKSYTIDDILADSDSDSDLMNIDEDRDENSMKRNANKKKSKKHQSYIKEDPESIVDLVDINSIANITTAKPEKQNSVNQKQENSKKSQSDSNRGFKTAPDGRLIIAEPKRGQPMSDDSDEDIDVPKKSSNTNTSRKRNIDDDDDDDTDEDDVQNRKTAVKKQKSMDTQSMFSGRSSNKYVAGGKGIHRPTTSSTAGSVKSGTSRISKATTVKYGSEYTNKKGSGDVKKRHDKLEPYAYIQLNRSNLNKRKRAKNQGQFKNIVKGARKGAAAGSKKRMSGK